MKSIISLKPYKRALRIEAFCDIVAERLNITPQEVSTRCGEIVKTFYKKKED